MRARFSPCSAAVVTAAIAGTALTLVDEGSLPLDKRTWAGYWWPMHCTADDSGG